MKADQRRQQHSGRRAAVWTCKDKRRQQQKDEDPSVFSTSLRIKIIREITLNFLHGDWTPKMIFIKGNVSEIIPIISMTNLLARSLKSWVFSLWRRFWLFYDANSLMLYSSTLLQLLSLNFAFFWPGCEIRLSLDLESVSAWMDIHLKLIFTISWIISADNEMRRLWVLNMNGTIWDNRRGEDPPPSFISHHCFCCCFSSLFCWMYLSLVLLSLLFSRLRSKIFFYGGDLQQWSQTQIKTLKTRPHTQPGLS